ncbi:MAG: hypothetical protein ACI9MU_004553 [Alphaproteobacteria bacterium]
MFGGHMTVAGIEQQLAQREPLPGRAQARFLQPPQRIGIGSLAVIIMYIGHGPNMGLSRDM